MIISRIELHELNLPLAEPFIISGGVMRVRRSLMVILHDDEGHIGYGEAPPFELPFYSEETLAGARDLLERVLIPRIRGRAFTSPEAVDEALRDGVRGNPFARSGVETAAWDLEADRKGVGLAQLFGSRLGVSSAREFPCGVALGIPADRNPDTLRHQVTQAIEKGYRRVKIKIAPGWDQVPVEVAREAMAGTDLPLTADANGAYRWPEQLETLQRLDQFGLLYLEQPFAPEELVGHAAAGRRLTTPICLDETLRDAGLARQIAELGGPRIWNLKVHRVGGLSEAARVYREALRYGAGLWAGTMPESGLGSQAAIAAASLPGFGYPSDVEPSTRWFGERVDVIELRMSPTGFMAVPERSIRHLLDHDRLAAATRRIL